MFNALTKYHQHLRDRQLSNTKTRELVFRALQIKGDLTMNQLTSILHGQVNRASIYRTIQVFEAAGIVRRLNVGWKYRLELSEAFSSHHHHVTCTNCQKVVTFQEDDQTAAAIARLAEQAHFTQTIHQLEIHGLCADCSVQKDPET